MRTCFSGATTMKANLQEDILAASKARFDALEIWAGKLDEYLKLHTIEDVKNLLDDSNLKAASLLPYSLNAFVPEPGDYLLEIHWAAVSASELECPLLVVYPDVPAQGMPESQAYKQAGHMARQLAEICENFGVKLGIEPLGQHPFIPGPREALRLLEEADHSNIGLVLDTFSLYKSDVPIEEIRAIPAEKLCMIQVSDCEEVLEEPLRDEHRLYPGLGVVPLEEMISAVADGGYDGDFSVEVFRQEYWKKDPALVAREAKQHLDTLLARLGLMTTPAPRVSLRREHGMRPSASL